MWPWCEENRVASAPDGPPASAPAGTNCNAMIVSSVRAPAYATIIGAMFYAPPNGAAYAFPWIVPKGLFFSLHGSWHENTNGVPVAVPEVVFVPMSANDAPTTRWTGTNGGYTVFDVGARTPCGNPAPFMNGFQTGGRGNAHRAAGRDSPSDSGSLVRQRRRRGRDLPHPAAAPRRRPRAARRYAARRSDDTSRMLAKP